MREAFLRAMDMKTGQPEGFFNALSSRQVKTSLHRVKMMTYNEKSKKKKTTKKIDFSFFVPMRQEMLNFKFREFSRLENLKLSFPERYESLTWKFGIRAKN